MHTEVEPEIRRAGSPVGMPMNTAPKGQATLSQKTAKGWAPDQEL